MGTNYDDLKSKNLLQPPQEKSDYKSFDCNERLNYVIDENCYELNRDSIFNNRCYDLPSSSSPVSSRKNYQRNESNDYKNKSVMMSRKDKFTSPLSSRVKNPKNKFATDDTKNVEASPFLKNNRLQIESRVQSLKRSHSVLEGDTEQTSFTPVNRHRRMDERHSRSYSWESPQNRYSTSSRKSFPSATQTDLHQYSSDSTTLNRRRSFPFAAHPHHSPVTNTYYRRCATDQTPYTPENYIQHSKRRRTSLPYYNAFDLMSLESESGFIDSHCHLDFLFQRQDYEGTYSDYQKMNRDTFPRCYKGCLTIFCNPFTFSMRSRWEKILNEDNVWASFGCHPHNAKDYNDAVEESLCIALEHSKVRALGEIGLDYSNRNKCMKEVQFEVFRRQLKLALRKELPVVIHCREAHEDGMNIIKEILPIDYTIHLHCFTDTWEWAEKWLNDFPNLFIGITNVVTFPSAQSVHEVARKIPLERLLLETDAPYFIPKMGVKGIRWSHPGMAIHVAAQIAALRNVPIEQVLQATRRNTKSMYNI